MVDNAWFGASLRKSHILYVSPEWVTDRGSSSAADGLVAALADAGFDCIELYCKDHHGHVYFPSDHGIKYPRDVVAEAVAATRERGMRFIAYVSICFDQYLVGLHRDWAATDVRGRARVTGTFTWLCLRSPYRDLVLAQIEELVKGYDIDGLWLDIIPIAWPSAYTNSALTDPTIGDKPNLWMIADVVPCYCYYCRTQFAEEYGRSIPLSPDEDDERLLFEFGLSASRDLVERARGLLREYRPGAILTYNAAGAPGDALDASDLVSIEGHAPYYSRQDIIGRWARGRGQPFEVLSAGALPSSPGGWNGLDPKPEVVLRVESSVASSHGGSMVFGHAPNPSAPSDAAQLAEVKPVNGRLRQLEPHATGARNVAEILLASTIKPLDAPRQWGRMFEAIEYWNDILRDGHHLYDVGGLNVDLSGYRLVILPDQVAMSDAEVVAIRSYVRAGGALLATGDASLSDGRGRPHPDFALADVFGAENVGRTGQPITYVTSVDEAFSDGLTAAPIAINREARRLAVSDGRPVLWGSPPVRPFTDGSTVLYGYPPPDESDTMVIGIEREEGLGCSVYIGVPLDGDEPEAPGRGTEGLESAWTRRIADNLVRHLLPDPMLTTDAPPGVALVLQDHGDRWVLHLVDYHAGDPRRLPPPGRPLVLGPIRISLDRDVLPVAQAIRGANEELSLEDVGGRLEVTLDGLSISEYVVLRRTP